ncbi:MAG: UbiX family flavin prenyltransferase [Desulfovibrionaceae bacterium]|nr:UbiX family flavin prenyltransferase [Desulfovibrionaceae bacterium]
MPATKRVLLALTGASGMPYAWALAKALAAAPGVETHLIASEAAAKVLELESDLTLDDFARLAARVYSQNQLDAAPASGSWRCAGMIVCPCSMASLAAIASGLGHNLIHRAADVTLKERRPLILTPRETPFNRIHMENMLRAHDAGATILAACPGFYHKPGSIAELADFIAARALDLLGLPQTLRPGWKEEEGAGE